MDELFELRLRRGLEDLIEPVTGDFPHWESSPAATQVGLARREGRGLAPGGLADRLPWAGAGRGTRLAWILVAAALLLTLAAIIGVAGSQREMARPAPPLPALIAPVEPSGVPAIAVARSPQRLVPTGIEILTPDPGDYGTAVVDVDGETIWLLSARGLSAFLPSAGSARTWTVADDLAFGSTAIAPARSGGVWLIGDKLYWFDGRDRFLDVISTPTNVAAAAEAADGTLWIATADGVIHQRAGTAWVRVDDATPSAGGAVSSITVDESGAVWTGWFEYPWPPGGGHVARFDGRAWTTFDGDAAAPLGGGVRSITSLADGSVWVATDTGLARFDGTSWATIQPDGAVSSPASTVGVGPDGSLWVAGANLDSGAVSIARDDGRSWTTWTQDDGLPESGWVTPAIVPTRDAVYVATGGGLLRLDVDRWSRAWPTAVASGPGWMSSLLPLPGGEAWAGDNRGLWHLDKGAWSLGWSSPSPDDGRVWSIEQVDGVAWAATNDGVLRLDGERWVVVDQERSSALAVAPDGALWIGGQSTEGTSGTLRTLRREGGTWVVRDVADPPELRSITSLAVGPDGTVWAGEMSWGIGGLARFDGSGWEPVKPLGASDKDQAPSVIRVAPGGDTWVALGEGVARFDGTGWTRYDGGDGVTPSSSWNTIAIGTDGTVWGASSIGPLRFDGTSWLVHGPKLYTEAIWAAADGSIWAWISGSLARFMPQ